MFIGNIHSASRNQSQRIPLGIVVIALLMCCQAGASTIPTPVNANPSANASNFNGTAIPFPRYIWFNAHLSSISGGTTPFTVYFQNQSITFSAGGNNYFLLVPDARVTIDPSAGTATTTFATDHWQTTALNTSNDPFLSGLAFQVPGPSGLLGGINPVAWTGDFFADQMGINIQWQWAAAVYTSFSTDYNTLGVTPIDGSGGFSQSGTPANFSTFVTGGARGGGGSNYTGSNSGTVSVANLTLIPEPASTSLLLVVGAIALSARRRQRPASQS